VRVLERCGTFRKVEQFSGSVDADLHEVTDRLAHEEVGRAPHDLLFTTSGGSQLWRTATVRVLAWETTGQGRRLHDLRHTAACLWLSRGVEPGTVQAWCGHESIATTNRYLHFLGTDADKAGLNKLNDGLGSAGGARDERNGA
jgi:integrase